MRSTAAAWAAYPQLGLGARADGAATRTGEWWAGSDRLLKQFHRLVLRRVNFAEQHRDVFIVGDARVGSVSSTGVDHSENSEQPHGTLDRRVCS